MQARQTEHLPAFAANMAARLKELLAEITLLKGQLTGLSPDLAVKQKEYRLLMPPITPTQKEEHSDD
ncbi:MAG: hypothetical protein U0Z53_23160 [Blastocatellia bacterium]